MDSDCNIGEWIRYEQLITEGRRKFKFPQSRNGAEDPVINHAKFLDL